MDEPLIAFSSAFGEPRCGVSEIPDPESQFGVELRSRRLGIAIDGRMHVVELTPEQLLALGTACTVAARVAGADEEKSLAMLDPVVLRMVEALLDRRLVKPAPVAAEVAGHA